MMGRFWPWLLVLALLAAAPACLDAKRPTAGAGPGQDAVETQVLAASGRLAIRIEIVERTAQALAGMIARVRLSLSGRNVPADLPPFDVDRGQFKSDRAQVSIGNLLPGPVHLDVTLFDAADLVLGTASADATVSADATTSLVLAVNPQTGTASVMIDPAELGEPVATPSIAFAFRAVSPGTWAAGPPLASARAGLGSGVVGGRLFAVGGANHLSLETFDPASGRWEPVVLPRVVELEVALAGTAVVRDQIVMLGGDAESSGGVFERIGPVYLTPGAGAGGKVRVVPFVPLLSPEGDQAFWRTAAGVAAVGDLAFLVGGVSQRTQLNPPGNGYVHPPATEVLDVGRGVWSLRAAIPTPRAGLALAAVGTRLVSAGGYRWLGGPALEDLYQRLPYFDAAQARVSVLDTVEVYDAQADTWSAAPALSSARHSAAVTVAGSRIYVLGGADAAGKVQSTVESWASGESAWRKEPGMPTARALCAGATGPDGIIAVLGGLDENGRPLRTVELYNPGAAP